MSLTDPYVNPFDLYTLWMQDQSEPELYARAATAAVVTASGWIDGEMTRAETRATNRSGDGTRCFVLETRIVRHEPGMLAEWSAASQLEKAASAFAERASLCPPAQIEQRQSEWQQDVGGSAAEVVSRSWGAWSAARTGLATHVRHRLARNAAGGELDRLMISELPSAVQDAPLDVPIAAITRAIKARAGLQRSEAINAIRSGRLEDALAAAEATRRFAEARLAELEQVQETAAGRAEAALSDANAAVAERVDDAPRTKNWLRRLWDWVLPPEVEDAPAESEAEAARVPEHLDVYVTAALQGRLAHRLRVPFNELLRGAQEIDHIAAQELSVVRAIGAAAAEHRRRVEQDADELQRHVPGLVTAADPALRDAAARSVTVQAPEALVQTVLRPAIETVRERTGGTHVSQVLAIALGASRAETASLRSADLNGFVRALDADGVARIANALRPHSQIEFRTDQPLPETALRLAVPGGSGGVLGQFFRTRLRDAQPLITDAPAPLVALAVLTRGPFAVDQLRAFHTLYREAREEARREGWEPRLVTDKRYLKLADGSCTDEQMDDLLVRGLVCGAVMRSGGGTMYLVPIGTRVRPRDVAARKLNPMFGRPKDGGGRVGSTVPEARAVLRSGARMREAIDLRWKGYCDATSPHDRLRALAVIEGDGVLPSRELLPALGRLRDEIDEEIARLARQAGARRPAPHNGAGSLHRVGLARQARARGPMATLDQVKGD